MDLAPNLMSQNYKNLSKNIDGNLCDLQFNNDFLTMTPKHGQQKKKKKDKLDFMKIFKILCIKEHYQEDKSRASLAARW